MAQTSLGLLFLVFSGRWLLARGNGIEEAWINEFHYDNSGSDLDEMVEVVLPQSATLSEYTLELYNGGSAGALYAAYNLDSDGIASTIDGNLGMVVTVSTVGIQNGAPDGIGLLHNGQLIECISYEGSGITLPNNFFCPDVGVFESSGTQAGMSLQRTDLGVTNATWVGSWVANTSSAGFINACVGQLLVGGPSCADLSPTPEQPLNCSVMATAINAVQGSGSTSPVNGESVIVRGIVTKALPDMSGFFLQTAPGEDDGDDQTSEGIFIFSSTQASQVSAGDNVTVEGVVSEYFSNTQITLDDMATCSSGNTLPSAVMVPMDNSTLEPMEGMLVEVPAGAVVTDIYNLARFGQFAVLRHATRPFTGTHLHAPGAAAVAANDMAESHTMIVADASTSQNPDPVIFPDPALSATNTLRSGYAISSGTGPLMYTFGEYTLLTDTPSDIVFDASTNPRDATPPVVGGTMKIAVFNVLNYFATDWVSSDARGADNAEEFGRQSAKIVSAILAMDADVVGLVEIQNDGFGSGSSVDHLVEALNNESTMAKAYEAVVFTPAEIGTDVITCKIIYRPAALTHIGTPAVLDSSVDPQFVDTKNRPVIAASFVGADGSNFTVAVGHLKSKGSDCEDLGDPDMNDGAGNCNGIRTSASRAMAQWLGAYPTGVPTNNIIITGDLNSYAMETPITLLVDDFNYTNMIKEMLGDSAYTYVFSGMSGYLDHMLASSPAVPCVTGVGVWHINADEPRALDYNTEFKSSDQVTDYYDSSAFRSSDHDPILMGLDLTGCKGFIDLCAVDATAISAVQGSGSATPMNGQSVMVRGIVTKALPDMNGFFLQTAPGEDDGDDQTSEGIFIFSSMYASQVSPGDKVTVQGVVSEYFSNTQITLSSLAMCSSGNTLPSAAMVPMDNSTLEPMEGMLVGIPAGAVVTDIYNLARFGQFAVMRHATRPYTGTHLLAPGNEAMTANEVIESHMMVIADGSSSQNPDPVIFPDPALSATNTLRSGYAISSGTGPLMYTFGEYTLLTDTPSDIVFDASTNPRDATPPVVGGTMKIAVFNVLNYFATDWVSSDARGADNAEEFGRQSAKIVSAILAMDADIVGLIEIQNDGFGSGSSVDQLVQALNDGSTAEKAYEAVVFTPAEIGTDVITCKIIYRPAAVTHIGTAAVLDSSIDAQFIDTKNRPVIAASFADTDHTNFTVAVAHLKSKGSDCDELGDPDMNDGAGNCNGVRTNASHAMGRWLATHPTGVSTEKVIVTGDLNSYAMETPITSLVNDFNYTDMVKELVGASAYTYVFSGVSGYLDHMLASSSTIPCITGLGVWHINADEPRALDYNTEFKSSAQVTDYYNSNAFRSSDHDPILMGLNLTGCSDMGAMSTTTTVDGNTDATADTDEPSKAAHRQCQLLCITAFVLAAVCMQ